MRRKEGLLPPRDSEPWGNYLKCRSLTLASCAEIILWLNTSPWGGLCGANFVWMQHSPRACSANDAVPAARRTICGNDCNW